MDLPHISSEFLACLSALFIALDHLNLWGQIPKRRLIISVATHFCLLQTSGTVGFLDWDSGLGQNYESGTSKKGGY